MVLEFISSPRTLLLDGKAIHVVDPLHLVIDKDMKVITMRKRNNNLISVSEQVIFI